MPLMCIVMNPPEIAAGVIGNNSEEQLLLSGAGVSAQKIKLVGYQVVFRQGTGMSAATNKIPSQVFVDLDFVGGSQLHVASGRKIGTNTQYQHIHAIPLACEDDLTTIKFGLNPIEFNISQRINKHINISVKRYDDNSSSTTYGKLVPISTDSADRLAERYALAATDPQHLISGSVALQSLVLYFDYDFSSIF